MKTLKNFDMTQDERNTLLVDLCARLPYEVKGRVYAETTKGEYDINGDMIFYDSPFDVTFDAVNTSTEEIHVIAIGNEDTVDFIEEQQTDGKPYTVDEFKPYLRPMSSITEDEKEEIKPLFSKFTDEFGKRILVVRQNKMALYQDWLNAHHFDYRGLIKKSLALEAPEGMYNVKTE